ncbi:hypothetical protein VB780_05300 [Leptolyngbya sp. CCNP1308]|uniref:hypothetical protein n=1 Tax=Leptolyngbya sp. CCNP1308 TaxID=3110255 RepID=UPI002B205C7A|nr:hypothetical protein [Leptolyngbya sp. CCNP1308]MEA5447975.1 hypothetical protein [Leptolyngbya sp. CCNP1308]
MGLVGWATWARAARGARPGVVVAVAGDRWAAELPALCPQALLKGAATCPQTGALAVWLVAADELLLLVPEPPRHGSQTPGNLLPW